MSARHRTRSAPEQLPPGDLAPRDAGDLTAYPFFSPAKTHRISVIDEPMNDIAIRVGAWNADALIRAAGQIVQAHHAGVRRSRLAAATPADISTLIGRGVSARDCRRPKAAFDRLQSTKVASPLRQTLRRRLAP